MNFFQTGFRKINIPPSLIKPLFCISFISSIVFIFMRRTVPHLIATLILLVAGCILSAFIKPQEKKNLISISSTVCALVFGIFFSEAFYQNWVFSQKLYSVATILKTSVKGLTAAIAFSLLIASLLFLSALFQQIIDVFRFIGKKAPVIQSLIFALTLSVVCVVFAQTMQGLSPLSMGIGKFIFAVFIVFSVLVTLFAASNATVFSMIFGSAFFAAISIANAYVYSFRERLFAPIDVFSITTAINVRESYSLFPIPRSILSAVGILAILLFVFCTSIRKTKFCLKAKSRILTALCCLISLVIIGSSTANLKSSRWYNLGAIENGYILDFTIKLHEIKILKPAGYSQTEIQALSQKYTESKSKTEEKSPHILVVMSEAFSDLSVVGELNTNMEVTPFISSLKENTIHGMAQASVYGGNTASSEFEFLTGNSMAWFPANSVPYEQYIKAPAYSMPHYLKSNYGYKCIAMHPYTASGWNRPEVYEHFDFDETYFIDDFPNEDLIRCYISDQELFDQMIKRYEENKDNPLFLFGVSMQNHGGYQLEGGYDHCIKLKGYDKEYPEVEQYLSLLHETDKAVENLIRYFDSVDDDVLILFFGDHQPIFDNDFLETLNQGKFKSLSDIQKKHQIPFFIWANYDIKETQVQCTSLNYLSNYVYQNAGLPLPPYNEFLSEMEKEIPSINAYGFYSKESKCFLPFSKANKSEREWLKKYESLQYNNVFDNKNRNKHFFPSADDQKS